MKKLTSFWGDRTQKSSPEEVKRHKHQSHCFLGFARINASSRGPKVPAFKLGGVKGDDAEQTIEFKESVLKLHDRILEEGFHRVANPITVAVRMQELIVEDQKPLSKTITADAPFTALNTKMAEKVYGAYLLDGRKRIEVARKRCQAIKEEIQELKDDQKLDEAELLDLQLRIETKIMVAFFDLGTC